MRATFDRRERPELGDRGLRNLAALGQRLDREHLDLEPDREARSSDQIAAISGRV